MTKVVFEYEVTLVCGHRVKTRGQVFQKKATFGCPMQPRCGYNVRWRSWRNLKTGMTQVNDEV